MLIPPHTCPFPGLRPNSLEYIVDADPPPSPSLILDVDIYSLVTSYFSGGMDIM